MRREIVRTHKFGKDLRLNPFGDYDTLKMHAIQEDVGKDVQSDWSLTSSRGAPDFPLNDDDLKYALVSVFMQGS